MKTLTLTAVAAAAVLALGMPTSADAQRVTISKKSKAVAAKITPVLPKLNFINGNKCPAGGSTIAGFATKIGEYSNGDWAMHKFNGNPTTGYVNATAVIRAPKRCIEAVETTPVD